MKYNNIVAIERKTMILGAIFSYALIEFDMPDVETFMEEGDSSQSLDMKEDDTINDTCLVPLRTLIDINNIFTGHIPPTGAVSLSVTAEFSEEKVRKRKMKGSYRRYSAHQIEQLFDYVFEQIRLRKRSHFWQGLTSGQRKTTINHTMITSNDVCLYVAEIPEPDIKRS
jgi:stalled ribosome alternative rescue factor ArfA